MSKVSGFAILLAVVLAGMAASCKSMTTAPTTSATGPSMTTMSTTTAPAMAGATTSPTTAPVAAAGGPSPWDGSSIFFIPMAFIVLTFAIAMFSSRSKTEAGAPQTAVLPVGTRLSAGDDLATIAELWPRIPPQMRSAIMSVIRAAVR